MTRQSRYDISVMVFILPFRLASKGAHRNGRQGRASKWASRGGNDTTKTSIYSPAVAFPNVCMGPLLHSSSDANSRLNKNPVYAPETTKTTTTLSKTLIMSSIMKGLSNNNNNVDHDVNDDSNKELSNTFLC